MARRVGEPKMLYLSGFMSGRAFYIKGSFNIDASPLILNVVKLFEAARMDSSPCRGPCWWTRPVQLYSHVVNAVTKLCSFQSRVHASTRAWTKTWDAGAAATTARVTRSHKCQAVWVTTMCQTYVNWTHADSVSSKQLNTDMPHESRF